jgi:hypothetical protein
MHVRADVSSESKHKPQKIGSCRISTNFLLTYPVATFSSCTPKCLCGTGPILNPTPEMYLRVFCDGFQEYAARRIEKYASVPHYVTASRPAYFFTICFTCMHVQSCLFEPVLDSLVPCLIRSKLSAHCRPD